MTEKQARAKGYDSTGHYSKDKEAMKAVAKLERAKGNKAVTVSIPHNKYSRGHGGTGYAVYTIVSEVNKKLSKINFLKNRQVRELKEVEEAKKVLKVARERLYKTITEINELIK